VSELNVRKTNPMKFYLFVVSLISLAGCSSASHRIKDDISYFQSLDEAEQANIAKGDPQVGDSVRGLLIAFGKPAFSTRTPEGTEFTYLRVTSKRYPRGIEVNPEHIWEKTTDLHILIRDEKIVRVKAQDHYEDRDRGVARDVAVPRVRETDMSQ
jgi:hypothetical protein